MDWDEEDERISRHIADAVSRAVALEREACAKAVEDFGHSNGRIRASHKHAARAIRARTVATAL